MTPRRLVIEAPAEAAVLEIEGHEFAVRIGADLDVDVMAEIVRLEVEIRRYGRKHDRMADWVSRAKQLILRVVELEHPPPDELEWLRSHSMGPSVLFQILTFIGGNPAGPAEEVSSALTEGLPESARSGEPGDPTTSQKRSRSRRSRSGNGSTSPPDTGEGSDGATSGSTSPTPIAA